VLGSGTVRLDPPGGTYDADTVVTLTAAPLAGHAFTGWSGDLTGTANPTTLRLDADKSVTATFQPARRGRRGR
ncbi:MAG: InlB B-repeat-containing protein, partial [Candidatus Rokuibacteriota bacterium]